MLNRKVALILIIILFYILSIYLLKEVTKRNPVLVPDGQEILRDNPVKLVSEEEITPITLDKIFDGIDTDTDIPGRWTLLVGGDVMIGRTVNYKTITYKNFDWPYEKVVNLLSEADVAYVNLESPVVDDCPVRNDGMIFCGNINHIAALRRSGLDMVSLANNHMLNQGKEGLEETLFHLQLNGIIAVGAPNPTYLDIKDTRVAFLAYTDIECYPGVECVNPEKIKADIESAKPDSDLIIIMYHWGAEYRDYPTDRQKEIAHLSIDSGADLILGNHPHWIQPFEIYKDKLIMYSHGNLVFDQMWSQKTREGVLVEYIFDRDKLIDAKVHPVLIEDYGQPQILEDEPKATKVDFIKKISENLSTGNY